MKNALIYKSTVARGGNGHARNIAPSHQRYVGMYYWCGYWAMWDKVLAVENGWWTVQTVDLNGNPKPGEEGRVRKHCTAMEATHFADQPFEVMGRYDQGALQ